MKPIYNKKVNPELIEKVLSEVHIPEVKRVGENLYEFRSGNFVVQGTKESFENMINGNHS